MNAFVPSLLYIASLLCALVLAVLPARALETWAVTQDGAQVPPAELSEVYQGLEVALHNQVAATRTAYRFRSQHHAELELSCLLSLQRGEMVDGFRYWNGDEEIVGEVLERQAASQVYEQLANVERRDPGILEQLGDRFRFRVFPVAPGETKPVEVRSVTALPRREGWIEYRIARENLPPADAVYSLAIDLSDDLPIEEVRTEGFVPEVERLGPHLRKLRFESHGEALEQDLVIRYRLAARQHALRFSTHRGQGQDGTFALIVSPKDSVEATEVIGRDIVFVVDVSGSMDGEPLKQAKLGLGYALSRLNDADRFEILAFDDDNRRVFGALRDATAAQRQVAQEAVGTLASGGGTNIDGALMGALDALDQGEAGRPRAIIFLTDGQGGTPPEVVASHVRARSKGVRIYSFGAGDGVNRHFLRRLAEDNRGVATFIDDDRHIEREMRHLYDRIAMPLMVDLSLDFEGLNVHSVYPRRLPDLYRDGEVVVVGRYSAAAKGKVVLKGKVHDRVHSLALPVILPNKRSEHGAIEKLWASKRIEHLLGVQATRGASDELTGEITRLGVVYNMVTPYTTFLAVPASLQTDKIKEMIRQGRRGYDKKLIDSMQGIRLSQTHIPPGDPVLSVVAPADARRVTAFFPFGLVKRMGYDPARKHWHARFLVPRDVKDGRYRIRVKIVEQDGTLRWKSVDYVIDSAAPELDAYVPEVVVAGDMLDIDVDPFEPVAQVRAHIEALGQVVDLALDPETGLYRTQLPVPLEHEGGTLQVRIVVRDLARNRFEQSFQVDVIPDIACCHEGEEDC